MFDKFREELFFNVDIRDLLLERAKCWDKFKDPTISPYEAESLKKTIDQAEEKIKREKED